MLLDLNRFRVPYKVGELWKSIFEGGDGDLNGGVRAFVTRIELPLCAKDGLIIDEVYVLGSTPFFYKCDIFEVIGVVLEDVTRLFVEDGDAVAIGR